MNDFSNYDSSDDLEMSFAMKVGVDIAPKIINTDIFAEKPQQSKFIQANLPIAEQEKFMEQKSMKDRQEITMLDSIWKEMHHKKNEKSKTDKSHKHKRVIPWDESKAPEKEAPIFDRVAYANKLKNRTWKPLVGNQELEDTAIWFNVINHKDHLGRSWVKPPLNLQLVPHECCLPKVNIHTYSYHTAMITDCEMIPDYGHFILSSSLDSTIRIWSLFGDRQCIQSYIGHQNGVRDIAFNRDGMKFASICFGKKLKYWETDHGNVFNNILLDDIPVRIAFPPLEDHSEEIIVALANGSAVHYDFRLDGNKEKCLVYNYHTKPTLSLAFLPGTKYFVTSSEDTSIALWEMGIDKPLFVCQQPWMSAVTALVAHPKESAIAAQMAGKEIAVFKVTSNSLEPDVNRSFVGCETQSFPCRPSFSPDGGFLVQGDKDGVIHIWDWKSTTQMKTFSTPNNMVISKCQWSPRHPSQIICGCHDNNMYLLD